MAVKCWPSKDPNEIKDYHVDWADDDYPRLETGETLASSVFVVAEGTVVIDSESDADGVATVWLSGGTDGETCIILNTVVTSLGRVYEQAVKLKIKDSY